MIHASEMRDLHTVLLVEDELRALVFVLLRVADRNTLTTKGLAADALRGDTDHARVDSIQTRLRNGPSLGVEVVIPILKVNDHVSDLLFE